MNFTTNTTFLLMLFILPSLFGLTLIGEGVQKIMNYDHYGWVGVGVGAIFVTIILVAYFIMSSRIIG
jgi:hypothetical protein